jgi:hypothetical protein
MPPGHHWEDHGNPAFQNPNIVAQCGFVQTDIPSICAVIWTEQRDMNEIYTGSRFDFPLCCIRCSPWRDVSTLALGKFLGHGEVPRCWHFPKSCELPPTCVGGHVLKAVSGDSVETIRTYITVLLQIMLDAFWCRVGWGQLLRWVYTYSTLNVMFCNIAVVGHQCLGAVLS